MAKRRRNRACERRPSRPANHESSAVAAPFVDGGSDRHRLAVGVDGADRGGAAPPRCRRRRGRGEGGQDGCPFPPVRPMSPATPQSPASPPPPPPSFSSSILLPVAVYRPASILVLLLAASILPKNTLSLRWLALGHRAYGGRGGTSRRSEGGAVLRTGGGGAPDRNRRREVAPSSSARRATVDGERWWRREIALAAVDAAELVGFLSPSRRTGEKEEEGDEGSWHIDWDSGGGGALRIVSSTPRGGGRGDGGGHSLPPSCRNHAGLINLGNTCYLNAQLQCAYHVPLLRRLVANAEDKEVEVEVEVEVVDEEPKVEAENFDGEEKKDDEDSCGIAVADLAGTGGTCDGTAENATAPPPETKRETKVVREMLLKPVSPAMRALQRTFSSLTSAASASSSGETRTLVHSLGINPFLQQDGQEFWKLFVPEIESEEFAVLYAGKYEDYVREILPPGEEGEAEKEDYEMVPEEEKKKEKEGTVADAEQFGNEDGGSDWKAVAAEGGADMSDSGVEAAGKEGEPPRSKKRGRQPRERVRVEPFLDLSIPVSEGSGGSVESTLRSTFTEPEILYVSEGNGWRPSKGSDKVDAHKGSSLKADGLPPLLQLHLKRFKYDWETGETSKINDRCGFPRVLDLSDICKAESEGESEAGGSGADDAVYDLQSIVVHKGEYGSGHYYSYVRPDIRSNEWYRFDDQFVTKVGYEDVVADASGGQALRQARRQRSRSTDEFSADGGGSNPKRRRGLLRRILSFGFLERSDSESGGRRRNRGGGFGYGGRTSSAYMLQYARRSDIPRLFLEEEE